jgi:phage portal protein BeeE
MDTADARQYMTDANTASRNHGDAYMAGMKVDQVGWNANEIQLLEARQHDAVEAARVLAMPPRYVAAPTQGDSLTYSNLTEVRRDLIDIGGLANYLSPIEQRLSMPDMTPAGSTVKFDAESYFLRITPDQESQPAESPASQPTESAVTT